MTAPTDCQRAWVSPLLLALLLTGLASLKPMHIDETANYYYAVHIADHPLDPFGFEVFWYQWPEPANHVLTPPVMVSWWAVGVRLLRPLGEQPILWKLWLLPFALLFVFALHALLRRFARGLEAPLLWLTVLSPAILPGLNLMPDVPALAFSLGAVAVFLRAVDGQGGRSYGWAWLAGLLAGVAMQTKYTGFLAPAVLGLAALLYGRPWLWPVAAAQAAVVFVSWEYVTFRLYGDSHFLFQLGYSSQSLPDKLGLVGPLLSLVGGVAPAVGLLGLAALGVRRWVVLAAGGVVVLGYLTVACVGILFTGQATVQSLFGEDALFPCDFSLSDIFYGVWGAELFGILAAVAWRLCRSDAAVMESWRQKRGDWFLVLWLALEVVGYFFLTPFPAVRRVMGAVIVAGILVGRLAARTCRTPERSRLVWGATVFSALLGLGFLGVDIWDAGTQKRAVEEAAAFVRQQGGGRTWYVGHWGFQYYAEREGMKPVVPDESELRAGDWLVMPDRRINQQVIQAGPPRTEPVWRWKAEDGLPLKTVVGYYGGWTPLEHQQGPRLEVEVRRVRVGFVPRTPRSSAP
jgi:hypothetical protein